jgi:hypothetical protein
VTDGVDQIDELADATVEQAEAETEVVRIPPFAAIVSRAHRLAPDRISANAVPTAAAMPLPPLQHRVGSSADDSRWLAPFVADAREQAELELHHYFAAASPPSPPGPARKPHRWWPLAVGMGATALAAAVVLALLTPSALTLLRGDDARPSQAAGVRDDDGPRHEVERVVDRRERARRPRDNGEIELPALPPPAPPPSDPPSSRKPTLGQRLQSLDAEAERQLAEGDLDSADDTLHRLIRLGGRHHLVELAYGDRFTIAHRQRDSRRQLALWREYLRHFPRGRLADDARAGVCRHTPNNGQRRCWEGYLEDFPRGAYTVQAEAALAQTSTDTP